MLVRALDAIQARKLYQTWFYEKKRPTPEKVQTFHVSDEDQRVLVPEDELLRFEMEQHE